MPNNRRLPGWLNGDPDYEGTTIAERRQMQNTWDLLAEQEKANQIEQEKLEYIKQKDLKQNENNFNKGKEQIQDIEKIKQLCLCNSVGVSYSELELFFEILENGNIELLNKIQDIKLKLQNNNNEQEKYKLEYEQEAIILENENFKEKVYSNFVIFRANHYNNKMERLFKELNFNIVAINDEKYDFSSYDSEYFTFEGDKTCADVFNEIYEDRGTEEDYINFIRKSITSNGEYSEIDIKNEKLCRELNVDYGMIMKFYNLLLDIKKIAKEKYDEWNNVRVPQFLKEIEDNQPLIRSNIKIQECYDNAIQMLPDILVEYSSLLEKDIDNIENCPEDIREILHNRLMEFNEFRYMHYNEKIELLFRKLNLKKIDNLDLDKIKATGTINDYINYINNYIAKGELV